MAGQGCHGGQCGKRVRQNRRKRWNSNVLLCIDTLGSLPSDALRHNTHAFVDDIRKRHLYVYTFAYVIPKAPKNEQELTFSQPSLKNECACVRACVLCSRSIKQWSSCTTSIPNKASVCTPAQMTQTKTNKRKTNSACTHACSKGNGYS